VTLDGSGSCQLIQALQNATAGGSAGEQSACNNLTAQIQLILQDSSWSYEQQLAQISITFEAFFVQYSQYESFFLSISISGYGSVQSFLTVCQTYEQITTLSVVIGGGATPSTCVLLGSIQAAIQSGNYTEEENVQFTQYLQLLEAYFNSTTSIELRLTYISLEFSQVLTFEPFMVNIFYQIQIGSWGSFYQIIFCSSVCQNYGCGNLNVTQTTTVGSSVAPTSVGSTASSPKASTAAASAGTTSAPVATTSAPVPHNCATIASLIYVDVTFNTTILTTSFNKAYANFTNSQRLGANTCKNGVENTIFKNTTYATTQAKLANIRTIYYQYNNNSATNQALVFNIQINGWYGTIGQFVSCIN